MRKTILFSVLFHLIVLFAYGQQSSIITEIDSLLEALGECDNLEDEQQINLSLAKKIVNGHQSLKYSKRSLEIALETDKKENIADSYIEMSQDYERMNDFAKASEAIFSAAKLYEEIGFNRGSGVAFNMLSQLYFSHSEYLKSISYLTKAIQLHLDLKDSIQLADDYNNLGEVYRVKGTFDSALYYFNKANTIYQVKKYKMGIAYSLGNIGLVHAAKGDKSEAQRMLNQATIILKELEDLYPIAIFNIEMAKVNLAEGETQIATHLALKAYKIAEQEGLKEQMRDASLVLYQIYNQDKDYQKAVYYLNTYYANKDSIINEQTIQKIADLQTEYEVSRKEEQLTKLSAENKRNIAVAIFLGIGLFIIGVLFFYVLVFNKRLKKANTTLDEQRLQLETQNDIIQEALTDKETLLKEIHHRVKNNLQIISSLLNLQSNTLEDSGIIEIFQTGQSRIQSIALIHQKLYQNEEFSVIDVQDYIEQLSHKIIETLLSPEVTVDVKVNAQNILLDIDTAVPLGLIINELLTNSIKYAFLEMSTGTIDIQIIKHEDHGYRLHFSDSGQGLPEGMKLECAQTLGSRLINILTRQLGGKVNQYNEKGAHFIIQFYDMVKRKEMA